MGEMERARTVRHEAGVSRWELAMRPPAAHLRPYLAGLCGYVERTDGPCRRTELPSLGVVLIFDFGDLRIVDGPQATHHPGGFVAGIGDRPAVTEHDGVSRGLQVNLSALDARRVLGVSMEELTNRVVRLDDLVEAGDRGLTARLQEARGWDERFDRVEEFVAARVARAKEVPPVVRWAIDRIVRSRGSVEIAALARESGFSAKHLLHLFREHVGLPPKRVARLVRFDAVVRYLKRGGTADWGEIAHRFGFADQPHLNRELRSFAGATPTEVRAAIGEVGDVFG
jgi:AraC-like DNA-binding protein